jgi:hypothetical protein
MDNGDRNDAIIIDFLKAFGLVSHNRLLIKTANSGVALRVVAWVREFLLGHTQRVTLGGQLSGVPQGSILGYLLILAYFKDILRNIVSTIVLFLMTV